MKSLLVAMTACLAVLGSAGSVYAAQLTSPSIFAAHTQDIARCAVVNGGATTVAVNMKIIDESGQTIANRSDVINPRGFAFVDVFIPFGVAHACVVTTSAPVADLRAALTIAERIAAFLERPLRSAPLR
jgi:hypothetical protein